MLIRGVCISTKSRKALPNVTSPDSEADHVDQTNMCMCLLIVAPLSSASRSEA